MGKVVVSARIENLGDLLLADRGHMSADEVRRVEVPDAVVDTGATLLSLPQRLIGQLGLKRFKTRPARTAAGIISLEIFEAVRLTVAGRECSIDVAEVPDDCPALIGQIPLELLDFVVDPVGQRLLGNPDHHGEQMIDVL
jgi:predicted aspartyl protease